jgi:hypothetical protein
MFQCREFGAKDLEALRGNAIGLTALFCRERLNPTLLFKAGNRSV